jgi:hypothetical protein
MNSAPPLARKALILRPGQGRSYPMGRMRAVFIADTGETDSRYSVSGAKSRPAFDRTGLQGGDMADVEIFDHNSPQCEQHRCERPNTKFGPAG